MLCGFQILIRDMLEHDKTYIKAFEDFINDSYVELLLDMCKAPQVSRITVKIHLASCVCAVTMQSGTASGGVVPLTNPAGPNQGKKWLSSSAREQG